MQLPFVVQTLVLHRLSRRDLFDADENTTNTKAETPRLWGRERTYLGENSFSSRYFDSLWPVLWSNMQVAWSFCYWDTLVGLGWRRKVCSPSYVRDFAVPRRTCPWAAVENRVLFSPKPQLTSIFEERPRWPQTKVHFWFLHLPSPLTSMYPHFSLLHFSYWHW